MTISALFLRTFFEISCLILAPANLLYGVRMSFAGLIPPNVVGLRCYRAPISHKSWVLSSDLEESKISSLFSSFDYYISYLFVCSHSTPSYTLKVAVTL